MKRAAEERPRTEALRRRYIQQYAQNAGSFLRWQEERKWAESLPVNGFRKMRRIGGCMKSRCYLCHAEKLFGWPTIFELKAKDIQRDGEEELRPPGPKPASE